MFRNQIQVEVHFRKFYFRGTSSVRAIPNYSYAARIDNGQLLKYPSAAIKQRGDTSPGPSIYMREIDMELEFDSAEDWFFDLGRGESHSNDSIDFECNNYR